MNYFIVFFYTIGWRIFDGRRTQGILKAAVALQRRQGTMGANKTTTQMCVCVVIRYFQSFLGGQQMAVWGKRFKTGRELKKLYWKNLKIGERAIYQSGSLN